LQPTGWRLWVGAPAGAPLRGARFPARHPPCSRSSMAVRNTLARLAHGRSRRCHPGPAHCRRRAAAPTAESDRVVRWRGPRAHATVVHGSAIVPVAEALPPRRPDHPKLAHERSENVCQSAQPPADRFVQRLRPRRQRTAPAACRAARRYSGPASARQRARTGASLCLSALCPQGAPRAPACGLPRLCLAPPWHRRRRCGSGALAPPVPASTRGLPAPPRTAPPTPMAVRPHTPGGSGFRLAPGYELGLQRAHCAHSLQAPPGAGCAHAGACQHPGGPLRGHGAAVGVCGPARRWTSGAGTARAGRARAVPGGAGVGWRTPRGLGAPRPLPGRSGVSFKWSFTGGCALQRAGLGSGHCPRTAYWDAPWGDFPRWTSPGCRKRQPLATTFFLLLGSAM
jgi:hypothetical protein